MISSKVLFVVARDASQSNYNILDRLRSIAANYDVEEYCDEKTVSKLLRENRRYLAPLEVEFTWKFGNLLGKWVSGNILAPSKVIDEPITVERIREELSSNEFSHVVFTIYLNGYASFVRCVKAIRAEYPKVKIIGGAIGALLQSTPPLVDHVLLGDEVQLMRSLLAEDLTRPYAIPTIVAETSSKFGSELKSSHYGLLITSIGCPYACDFCSVFSHYGYVHKSFFSPDQIKDGIIRISKALKEKTGRDGAMITMAEPLALANVKTWEPVFQLFKDEAGDYSLFGCTTSKVLRTHNMSRLTQGPLRLVEVNVGVESMIHGYNKNKGVDLRHLFRDLQDNGIGVIPSFILGFDWHDHHNVWQDLDMLLGLEATGYIISNLEMQPGTRLYREYKESGRLLNVPPELLAFPGFQAFHHPVFKEGFTDMLPLILDAHEYVGNQIGSTLLREMAVFFNRPRSSDLAKETMKSFLLGAGESWQKSLGPEAAKVGPFYTDLSRRLSLGPGTGAKEPDLAIPS